MEEKPNTKDWYRFATMYARAAAFLIEREPPLYGPVSYMAYLSSECAMKGFLFERNPGLPLPETHNLKELCQACAWFEDGFAKELEHCESLGKFATPSGLPALVESSREDTLQALETSRVINALSRSQAQTQSPIMTM